MPALFSTGPPLPEVEKPGSPALCVASAMTARSQATAPARRIACSRQPGGLAARDAGASEPPS